MDRETGKRLTFSQKWGDDPFTQSGHTQVPNALISYAHRLGLRSEECWLITCILRFKYDASNPTPSQEMLAELFGQSVDTVQRTVKKIVDKRLLKVERIRDEETHRFTHTVYDFTPLRFALNECHYQDHPDERPQMPVIPEKATPQKCGMDTGSHTAEMRHGFPREPGRKSAAWATPQICGVDIGNKKSLNVKEKEALNVRRESDQAPASERPTLNASGTDIYALRDQAVAEVVALTGDDWSLRRFQQLWEVAEAHDALDAWKAALRATQRRLRASSKEGLDRPGAYFDRICVQELEKRGIFLPTIADKLAEPEVGEIIRQGLFADVSAGNIPEAEVPETPPVQQKSTPPQPVVPASPIPTADGVVDWGAQLQALEAEGGPAYDAFLVYVAAQRTRYESEMGRISEVGKRRLLGVFDQPEKRAELFGRWKDTRA